ncbi:hypothetical protein N183_37835 [Sinorhizobium sp. Sb3]|nr:hypothetical protein N183_37835 [Sinorhizobium sp. Sb3]
MTLLPFAIACPAPLDLRLLPGFGGAHGAKDHLRRRTGLNQRLDDRGDAHGRYSPLGRDAALVLPVAAATALPQTRTKGGRKPAPLLSACPLERRAFDRTHKGRSSTLIPEHLSASSVST